MKLSIITVNRNNASGLKKTIESVVSHVNINLEYLIIDGASTDSSVDIIKKFENKVTYWISEPDSGIYNAMNKGILKAKGDYLLFLNSVDYLNDNIDLDKLLSNLDSGEDLIYFNVNLVELKSGQIILKSFPDIADFKCLACDTLPHQATFIKRDNLIAYGCYSEKYSIISDWIYFLNAICQCGATYKHVPEVFSSFLLDGISTQEANRLEILGQRRLYLEEHYKPYLYLFDEWLELKIEIRQLTQSKSYRMIRKVAELKYKLIKH